MKIKGFLLFLVLGLVVVVALFSIGESWRPEGIQDRLKIPAGATNTPGLFAGTPRFTSLEASWATSTWETYSNVLYGFTIKYSPDFSFSVESLYPEAVEKGVVFSASFVPRTCPEETHCPVISLTVFSTDLTPDQFLAKNGTTCDIITPCKLITNPNQTFLYNSVEDSRTTMIAGSRGVQFQETGTSFGAIHTIVGFPGKSLLLDIANYSTGEGGIQDHYYNDMLSTLDLR